MAQSFAFSNDQDRRGDLEVCRATLGGTGDDQRSPTRAKRARRRLTRRIVVVIVMGRDIMGESASVKERLPQSTSQPSDLTFQATHWRFVPMGGTMGYDAEAPA